MDLFCFLVIHTCRKLAQFSFRKYEPVHVARHGSHSDVCSLSQVHIVDCHPKYSKTSGCWAAQVTLRYILIANAVLRRVVEASESENELPGRSNCQTGCHSCARQSKDGADSVQQSQQR